ncbi:hypothetical protein Tco_1027341 [Tanacetum coccineum]
MHTSKDDYLINTLRFVSTKEATQIYSVILPEILTSPEMKETKAYKTYLGFATGAIPPKIAMKFKKASPSKKDLNLSLVLVDKEPKSAKKKVPTKKTARKQTSGVVIRDTHVESSSKRKEKVDVARVKGIELLSEVALTEEAQVKEDQRKSLRDFHRTHPSGSGTVVEIPPSVEKSEVESWGNDKDDNNNDNDSESDCSDEGDDSDDRTQSNSVKGSDLEHDTKKNESDSDQQENKEEAKDDEEEKEEEFDEDKAEGVKDEELDYTTSLLYDDVDVRRNDPVQLMKGLVIDDAHVTISTAKKTKVPVTSSSYSSDLASKFLNFLDIPTTDTEIVSLMDVPVHHESSYDDAASLIEFELKKILINEMDKSESYLTAPEHKDCYDRLIKSYELDKDLFSTYDKVYSLKRNREDKDKDEGPNVGSDRGLKKRKTSKDVEPTKGLKIKESTSGSSEGTKSQLKSSRKSVQLEEPEFEVADSDMAQDQEGNMGNDDDKPMKEAASTRDWFTKPKQPQEPTNLDWNVGKTLQQGPTQSWLMTLADSTDKSLKSFDELMSTPIDFSAYIMNGLKI